MIEKDEDKRKNTGISNPVDERAANYDFNDLSAVYPSRLSQAIDYTQKGYSGGIDLPPLAQPLAPPGRDEAPRQPIETNRFTEATSFGTGAQVPFPNGVPTGQPNYAESNEATGVPQGPQIAGQPQTSTTNGITRSVDANGNVTFSNAVPGGLPAPGAAPAGAANAAIPDQNQPNSSLPFGRSAEAQRQIQANVAGIDRQTAALRDLREYKEGLQLEKDAYSATGLFSGRGGGSASTARARAMGDSGIYGKQGQGFGYGPGGVGDDGTGEFYRTQASNMLSSMPFGSVGDREKRKGIILKAREYALLGAQRDAAAQRQTVIQGGADNKSMLEKAKMQQDAYKFGVTSKQADRELDIKEYEAKNPAKASTSLPFMHIPPTYGMTGDQYGNKIEDRENVLTPGMIFNKATGQMVPATGLENPATGPKPALEKGTIRMKDGVPYMWDGQQWLDKDE